MAAGVPARRESWWLTQSIGDSVELLSSDLFPEGQHFSGSGEDRPSRKMTSVAYTASRDSVAEVTAVGCQARFFQ